MYSKLDVWIPHERQMQCLNVNIWSNLWCPKGHKSGSSQEGSAAAVGLFHICHFNGNKSLGH